METEASILIVDDIPQNIQVLGSFLSTHNYNISFATSAKEVLQLLNDNHYDLILLDVMMPEMNGYELCSILKSRTEYAEIPIIFITAKSDADSIIKGFQSGGVDYITKPFNSFELLARVETHLKLRSQSLLLQNMNQTLEEQVKKRTLELQNANNRLLLLEKTKSNFLQLISHELRTPISGINILADLLMIKLNNSDYQHYIESIKISSEKLIEFSELALLITSLSFDKSQLNIEPLNVSKLIENNLERYFSLIQEKNLEVEILGNSSVSFMGDPKLIDKCFAIVIDNSIKYSRTCGLFTIKITNTDQKVTVNFIDDGEGFSEEQLLDLFEPFNITDINHHKQGFGLSLNALKIIVEAHEGVVEISNNNSGRGAIVSISMNL
jgi:two-component system sensor histidine kinase/response regulator